MHTKWYWCKSWGKAWMENHYKGTREANGRTVLGSQRETILQISSLQKSLQTLSVSFRCKWAAMPSAWKKMPHHIFHTQVNIMTASQSRKEIHWTKSSVKSNFNSVRTQWVWGCFCICNSMLLSYIFILCGFSVYILWAHVASHSQVLTFFWNQYYPLCLALFNPLYSAALLHKCNTLKLCCYCAYYSKNASLIITCILAVFDSWNFHSLQS